MIKLPHTFQGGVSLTPVRSLRSLASSKLFLFACIAASVSALISTAFSMFSALPQLGQIMEDSLAQYSFSPAELAKIQQEIKQLLPSVLVFSFLFALAIAAIPSVGLWMTYSSTRSSDPIIKTTGLKILHIFFLIEIVLLGLNLAGSLLSIGDTNSFFSSTANLLEVLMSLAMLISARQLISAAKELFETGKTNAVISNRLPVLIIINLCITAGTLILQLISNFYTNPTAPMQAYIFPDKTTFFFSIAVAGSSIAELALFYKITVRAVAALRERSFDNSISSDD